MQKAGVLFNIQKFCTDDGPGIRTAVFFKGCPLRCAWCANPESQPVGVTDPGDRAYSVDEVVEICMQDEAFYLESGGGVTLTGGEPLMQPQFAAALLCALKDRGVHTALETCGHAAPAALAKVLPHADLFLFDVKHHNPVLHAQGTGLSNETIFANLRTIVTAEKEVIARIPVIPGYNDSLTDAQAFSTFLLSTGIKHAQPLPFHQFGEKKYAQRGIPYAMQGVPSLHPEDLDEFIHTMEESGLKCRYSDSAP